MYQLHTGGIVRLSDGALIPRDPDNRDYAEFAKWVAEGNSPLPIPEADWRSPIMADYSTRREVYLNRLAGIATFTSDQTVVDAAATFRQRLLDLPADPTVTGAADASALTSAILTLYRAASAEASAAAPAGKAAFDKIAR